MFNLIKILNGRLNVPEITEVSVYIDQEEGLRAGCVYYIEHSFIHSDRTESDAIIFIPVENISHINYGGTVKVKGFYPESNMVFETEIGFTEDDYVEDEDGNMVEPEKIEVKCGDTLSFGKQNYQNDSLRYEYGSDAKVIDNTDYESTSKLLVLLKW